MACPSEEALIQALEGVRCGVVLTDMSLVVTHANDRSHELIGDLQGSSQHVVRARQLLQDSLRHQRSLSLDIESAPRVTLTAAPLENGQGALLIVEDRECALRVREQATRAFAEAAHDVKAPVCAILAEAELLLGYDLPPEAASTTSRLRASCHSASMNIAELMDDAILIADNQPLALAPVALEPLIDELLVHLTPLAHKRGIYLGARSIGPVALMATKLHLARCLANLIANALNHTQPDGAVTLTSEVDADMVRICVTDTGCGIPADEIDNVWEEGFRSSTTRAAGVPGTGLGLGIVKRTVERMGGRCGGDVASSEGCVFWISLPLARTGGVSSEAVAMNAGGAVQSVEAEASRQHPNSPADIKL